MSKRERDEALAILSREVDLRQSDVARRQDSAISRSAVVVGSAVVAAGLQVAGLQHGLVHAVPVVFALLSAVLGVVVLRSRRGYAVPVGALAARLDEHTPRTLNAQLLRGKITILADEERALTVQSRWLLASYISLALAVLSITIEVIVANL